MKARIWLLGPASIEMNEIERILAANNESFEYVMKASERVTEDNAYNSLHIVRDVKEVIAINCRPMNIQPDIHMDVSLPGDPGHFRPAQEFLRGSAIGRVVSHLGLSEDDISWRVVLNLALDCWVDKVTGSLPDVQSAYARVNA